MAFPTIATLIPPITTTKGGGFYVEHFLYVPSPGVRVENIKAQIRTKIEGLHSPGRSLVWI